MKPFTDHFSARARRYASSRPSYPDALVDWIAALPERRSVAWDAGCGSGQLSVPLARRFGRVVASDASAAQVAAAPAHPRVRYRVARSEASALPAGVVDLAVVGQAAHWFDLAGYYAEVRRVRGPGSAIALVSYGRPRLPASMDGVFQRFASDVLGVCWPPERRAVDDGYRALPFPFDEVPAPAFTMIHAWDLDHFRAYVDTWSAVRVLERRRGPGPLRAFFDEIAAAWGDPAVAHEIRWPLAVRAGQ